MWSNVHEIGYRASSDSETTESHLPTSKSILRDELSSLKQSHIWEFRSVPYYFTSNLLILELEIPKRKLCSNCHEIHYRASSHSETTESHLPTSKPILGDELSSLKQNHIREKINANWKVVKTKPIFLKSLRLKFSQNWMMISKLSFAKV